MLKSVTEVVDRGEANMRRKEVVGLELEYVEVSVHTTHFASNTVSCLGVCVLPASYNTTNQLTLAGM